MNIPFLDHDYRKTKHITTLQREKNHILLRIFGLSRKSIFKNPFQALKGRASIANSSKK
jgi:hypothetical protein